MSKTKFSKVLALVIMLALVIGILPMGAMATTTPVYVRFFNGATQIGSTVSVTITDDSAYSAIVAGASANSSITSIHVDEFAVHDFNGLIPIDTDSETDAILYTVDDVLCPMAVGQTTVSAYSVVTVFYVQDYTTALYASIVPDGAATSGYAVAADNGDTVYYRVATTTVDFANLYTTIDSSTKYATIDSTTSYLDDTISVTGYTVVIPAYKPVVASSTSILSAWRTATAAAYDALTNTQQGMINSTVVSEGKASNATMTQVNNLARYVAPLTRENSKDLKRLSFSDSEGYMAITQTATGIGCFDPSATAYVLETATGSVTIHAAALASGGTISYSSSSTDMTVSNGVISFSDVGTYTLTVTVTNSGTKSYTVYITYAEPASGGVPEDVCGYLPVGQFARGNGWGALYTDGTNAGTTKKFLSGYVSTGVSLGLLGGYVQFDLGEEVYIYDNPKNPNGVDFIVYGNPFNGNPEAGSVMVSEDGKIWYNLAGSLHYDSDTTRNVTISYIKITADTQTIGGKTFTKGIHYSTDYTPTNSTSAYKVNQAIGKASWSSFVTGTAWWPEYPDTSENYGNVWNDGHICDPSDSYSTGDVFWNRNGAAEVITYCGVTQVLDDAQKSLSGNNATNYYAWGYADVRANGSSYGTAVNPYATLPAAAAGGDGFDLAWAVDSNGVPVDMSNKTIRFIRVYSAVLYNAGIFGETSAEVCGLYVANAASSSVGVTSAPTSVKYYKANDTTGQSLTSIPSNHGTVSDISAIRTYVGTETTLTVTVNATAGSTVYVNSVKLTESSSGVFTGTIPTPASDGKVRVLIQNGTAAPYLFVIN